MRQQLLIYRDGRLKVIQIALRNPDVYYEAEAEYLTASIAEITAAPQVRERIFHKLAETKPFDVYEEV